MYQLLFVSLKIFIIVYGFMILHEGMHLTSQTAPLYNSYMKVVSAGSSVKDTKYINKYSFYIKKAAKIYSNKIYVAK